MMLFMPIIVLFFQDNGMNMKEIMLLQAIYSVTVAAIEIPSGYVADVLGRKNSMIVGTTFGFIGMLIYCFTHGFWGFLPAAISLGIGQSFVSGSDTALMYDTLLELKREKDFIKLEGRSISVGNFAEAIASVAGGFLAEISLRTPFYFQAVIAFIGVPMAIMLIEPKVAKLQNGRSQAFKNIKNILHYALIKNKSLKWNIVYSSVIGVSTLTMAWFVQPYYKELSIEIKYFGIIGAVMNLAVAFTSFHAHRIESHFKENTMNLLILLFIGSGFIVVGQWLSLWSLLILLVFYLVRGIATPVLRDYINKLTPSEMRATVMSIRSFIIRALFAVTAPFLGYLADKYSIQQALLLSGILFIILGLFTLIFLTRSNKTKLVSNQ